MTIAEDIQAKTGTLSPINVATHGLFNSPLSVASVRGRLIVFIPIEGVEGDPWGAWENFNYYRRKYLEHELARAKIVSSAAPLIAESAELARTSAEFEKELDAAQETLAEERSATSGDALMRDQRLADLAVHIVELTRAIALAATLRRRLDEEIAIVIASMVMFFGDG